ncbi:myxosortase-dependent phytase-like phosphatase [Myxococcus fulvus]|uniref:myxosortase-dependent phytase-like phosphatase n=2 Tax=Myxococcus TaxID=32 RepID=UPI00200AAAB7|nr:myxosortase-dependent phytase-like phosphatase [Myxococcus fulvus]MCK8497468.1 phytase [Myxococcus fulvus]
MRHPLILALAAFLSGAAAFAQPVRVSPVRQTTPDPGASGANLRDVAIWVGSADGGADSLLLTAYDNANSGLFTFGLDGQQVESDFDGPTLGISLRDGFRLGNDTLSLAVTANSVNGLSAYRVDGRRATNKVERINVAPLVNNSTQFNSVALYRSPSSGRFYVFAGNPSGSLLQFELSGEDGGMSATLARDALDVGGAITGLVADEELGYVYVVQSGVAIWRYNAEPNGGTSRTEVASLTGSGRNLSGSVSRLALYRGANAQGYLLAADTTSNSFGVLDRRTYAFLGSFQMVAGDGGIGAVESPFALAVSAQPVGPEFLDGLFVAQDSDNSNLQNLKLVGWDKVAQAFTPPLRIDTRPSQGDGGTDGGSDAGSDGGGGGGGGPGPGIPGGGGFPEPDDGSGCSCATASVPGSVVLGLLALGLSVRRRRER